MNTMITIIPFNCQLIIIAAFRYIWWYHCL